MTLQEFENLFEKRCINCYPAVDRGLRNKNTDNPMPHLYLRKDLTQWAREAFERGEEFFYCKPINPKDPYGKLKLCKPEYRYFLKANKSKSLNGNLTEEQYNEIIKSYIS